ncbi:MAG: hypothetical protein HYX50_04750 [Chloroflexi bacterium]|nr:hypothetical protein [Chloroflexota bacterium]
MRAPGAADAGREQRPAREAGQRRDGRPAQRDNRGGQRGDRPAGGNAGRDRDRAARPFEVPVPQDERSVELGHLFRETQIAVRDARKALDKRRAEFDDEPDWMVEQLRAAEQRFEEVATEWSEHLTQTGRKVVRR